MYQIINDDNLKVPNNKKFDLIYCDYIYENLDFSWVDAWWPLLKENSIFMAQTDDSSMAQMKLKLDSMPNAIWINTCIYVQEWGGVPRNAFPRKHDYIFIYANGEDYKFYKDRIQVPKLTATSKTFNPSGRTTKTPCDVFYDLGNFSTVSNERVKDDSGHNVRWQKPLKLFDRIIFPFTDEEDDVGDPFMGVGSLGEWCKKNNRNYIGYENSVEIFNLAKERLIDAE